MITTMPNNVTWFLKWALHYSCNKYISLYDPYNYSMSLFYPIMPCLLLIADHFLFILYSSRFLIGQNSHSSLLGELIFFVFFLPQLLASLIFHPRFFLLLISYQKHSYTSKIITYTMRVNHNDHALTPLWTKLKLELKHLLKSLLHVWFLMFF